MKTQTQRAESHVRMGEDIGVIRVTSQPVGEHASVLDGGV